VCVCVAGGGDLDDLVGQVVTERRGNSQALHLLGGHHPAKGHPTNMLQTGYATRALPEVHTTVTSPRKRKQARSVEIKQKIAKNTYSTCRQQAEIFKETWTIGRRGSSQGRSHKGGTEGD